MFPFWDIVIAPVLKAAGAKRVVEIGALRGETTELLVEILGPDAKLHVIDPLPQFDPAEHERRFTGRYFFHRDTSHAVLPELEAMDAALIDGDHNWFTVRGELEELHAAASKAGRPLPLLMLHDVGWPYGRRDLYYEPDRIPPEHRQPYERRGMRPGVPELLRSGGANPRLANAVREGGPRNGVLTALDDFLADHEPPVRRLLIPIYFGLAIVVEESVLTERPELAAELDRLESPQGLGARLELAERIRLEGLVSEHEAVFASRARAERGALRYLNLLKGALLNEHHLELELRLQYLVKCIREGREPEGEVLNDPAPHFRSRVERLEAGRRAGSVAGEVETISFPYAVMGRGRLDRLEKCLDAVREDRVEGDLVECGVGRAGGSIFMRAYLEAYEMARPTVWVVDRFVSREDGSERNLTADLNSVRKGFARFGLFDERVRFIQGEPADTLAGAPIDRVALLRVDGARLASPKRALEELYDSVAAGGFLIVDGWESSECQDAVERFRSERGIQEPLERTDTNGVVWRKLATASAPPAARSSSSGDRGSLLVQGSPSKQVDLSVIVVLHNMRREAHRTLHALSRAYQEGIDDLDYEVLVVENGSTGEERLGSEFVSSFGPEFRYLDLGEDAKPSPAHALNRGIEAADGAVLALMIDGAHVLTPGVLRFGMQGISSYDPAVVATQQWYVGPGQQMAAVAQGYDDDYEDRLFHRIAWPVDGYRLFEIGHFVGDRDWFDGMWESNCLFTPRQLMQQVGAMDESFSMPGGGFANLDIFERLAKTPGVNLVTILGEGSFHQMHGGTTTNQADSASRASLLAEYRRHYAELRGRSFRPAGRRLHFVGSMRDSARRTRARRMGASIFMNTARTIAADARPQKPAPLPEELSSEFTEAYWRSFTWRTTTWLGSELARSPSDLLAYQEVIAEAAPEWIVELRTEGPELASFLASICDLTGRGSVLTVGVEEDRPQAHPKVTRLDGDPIAEQTVRAVREIVGQPANALLILGLARVRWLQEAFDACEALVPAGSWVILENTIMGGHPVWPGMGSGPAEASARIRRRHPDFELDHRLTNLPMSFNHVGYLRRTGSG